MGMPYEELRALAATDPRSARAALGRVLDSGSDHLAHFLERASAPGEGRVRQLFANLVRTRKEREGIAPTLLRWLEHETDEFARTALLAATEGIDTSRYTVPRKDLDGLVDTYRYVAERLCHRVRNEIPSSLTQARRIARAAEQAPEPLRSGLVALSAELTDELRMLARIVEFDEADEHFQWRRIVPMEWLPMYARDFADRYGGIAFTATCEGHAAESAAILGNDYHLETLFWNLFKNTQRAADGLPIFTARLDLHADKLVIVCEDNGGGFTDALAVGAFEDRVSTKEWGGGRGLLEVADAARRLLGSTDLIRDKAGTLRVRISLPVVHS